MNFRLFLTLFAFNLICLSTAFALESGGNEEITTTFSVIVYLITSTITSFVFSLPNHRLFEFLGNSTVVVFFMLSFLVVFISSGIIYLKIFVVEPMSFILSTLMLFIVYISEFFSMGFMVRDKF